MRDLPGNNAAGEEIKIWATNLRNPFRNRPLKSRSKPVMISKRSPVGIDIEQIKEKVERIAHKFMRKDELTFINSDNKISHLYVCWCAKEAVYKCFGQKEISFLDNILLDPFNFEGHGCVEAHLQKGETRLDYIVGYLQFQDYMVGYVKG